MTAKRTIASKKATTPERRDVKTVAGIDVGSNSVRMAVAEVAPDGSTQIIEMLKRTVRLGQDTFRRNRLGGQAMQGAIAVLHDYARVVDFYGVEIVRAVATSAVREARNCDMFVDRLFMSTGLDIEVIDTTEESRLIVSAVRDAGGQALAPNRANVLIADVGGGSTLLTVLHKGEIPITLGRTTVLVPAVGISFIPELITPFLQGERRISKNPIEGLECFTIL